MKKKILLISLLITTQVHLFAMQLSDEASPSHQNMSDAELQLLIERALAEEAEESSGESGVKASSIKHALDRRMTMHPAEFASQLHALSSIKRKEAKGSVPSEQELVNAWDELNDCQDFAARVDKDLDCTPVYTGTQKKLASRLKSTEPDATKIKVLSGHGCAAVSVNESKKVDEIDQFNAALLSGKIETIVHLLQGGVVPSMKEGVDGVLHKAAWNGQRQIAALLVSMGNMPVTLIGNDGNQPLHYAAYREQKEIVQYFHSEGADLKAVGRKGNSPLHCAAYAGALECVIYLLDNGALTLTLNNREWTPLHCAAFKGHGDILSLLIAEVLNTQKALTSIPKLNTLARTALAGGHKEIAEYLSKLLMHGE